MKRITEQYGNPCDYIESTIEEFFMLKEFLKNYGVEARMISASGDTCEWQIRNDYRNWVHLKRNVKACESIINIVEENIKYDVYSR